MSYEYSKIITDDTGKDLINEIRKLREALYNTNDNKPIKDISIEYIVSENEANKDRIRKLEDLNKEAVITLCTVLVKLADIFIDGDIPDDIDHNEFIEMLCKALNDKKKKHPKFFKENLLFTIAYGDIFTAKELKEYEHSLEKE